MEEWTVEVDLIFLISCKELELEDSMSELALLHLLSDGLSVKVKRKTPHLVNLTIHCDNRMTFSIFSVALSDLKWVQLLLLLCKVKGNLNTA